MPNFTSHGGEWKLETGQPPAPKPKAAPEPVKPVVSKVPVEQPVPARKTGKPKSSAKKKRR